MRNEKATIGSNHQKSEAWKPDGFQTSLHVM